jgi:glutamyl/glutaminyl-tRNA synthetase
LAEHLKRAGHVGEVDASGSAYLESIVPLVSTSVDRLDEAADRLRFLFAYDVQATVHRPEVAGELQDASARDVVQQLSALLADAPRLTDRDCFRAQVQRLREATGQKGRALLHPVRVALTGEVEGPELDLAIPAIDRGADLPSGSGIAAITGCRERAHAFAAAVRERWSAG